MKTKKTKTKLEKQDLELRLMGPKLAIEAYRPGNLTVRGAASLAKALETHRPAAMNEGEQQALETMVEGYEATAALLESVEVDGEATVQGPWNGLNAVVSGVTQVLVTQAGMPAPKVAARASDILARAFGEGLVIGRMRPREAWMELETVRSRLVAQPALRKGLEDLVQAEVVEAMLAAHQALGDALGVTRDHKPKSTVDGRRVIALLVQSIEQYVLCVAASATPGDAAKVARAEAALRPILTVREEARRRLRRGGTEEPVGAEPESVTAPEAPAADPAPDPAGADETG